MNKLIGEREQTAQKLTRTSTELGHVTKGAGQKNGGEGVIQ